MGRVKGWEVGWREEKGITKSDKMEERKAK
jgi:hypothetical protein